MKVYENVTKTPVKHEMQIILNQSRNGKSNLHRGINVFIKLIKEKYSIQGLKQDMAK